MRRTPFEAVSSCVCRSVCTSVVFGWERRWARARLLLLPLPWLRFKGALGNRRDGDSNRDTGKRGSCFTLFQDIIETIEVCVHTERRGSDRSMWGFLRFTVGTFLWISLHIDFMEKKKKSPVGVRFTFAEFSAVSSNYNNELWGSSGTQTPRELV